MLILLIFSYIVAPMPVKAAGIIKDPKTLGDLQSNLAELKRQKAENERKTDTS